MADPWWVACKEWAEAGSFATEEKARERAAELDKAPCSEPHYYWQAPTAPTYSTLTRMNIPEGAKRP